MICDQYVTYICTMQLIYSLIKNANAGLMCHCKLISTRTFLNISKLKRLIAFRRRAVSSTEFEEPSLSCRLYFQTKCGHEQPVIQLHDSGSV